jgi:hypothetical protein
MIKTADQMSSSHRTLNAVIDELKEATMSGDTSHRVEAGSVLWAIAEDLKKSLDNLKKQLREEALLAIPLGESGTEKFKGLHSGSAKVVVMSESVKPRKGADIDSLKTLASFGDVFEEVTTFKARRNAAEVVAGLPHGAERTALLESIDIVNGTPRVSFTRMGG